MARASFLPDWDDDENAPTRLDALPYALEDTSPRLAIAPPVRFVPAPRPAAGRPPPLPTAAPSARRDSYIRARSSPSSVETVARAFLDGAHEDHLTLTMNLLCLDDPTASVPAWDVSARAAARSLRARILELGEVRDALGQALADAHTDARLLPLLGPDAPLSAFVKGLLLWTLDVTFAFTELAGGLRTLGADWSRLRGRLAEANDWYFDELPSEIREEVARAGVHGEVADHLDELFFAAAHFAEGLAKRFG